MYNFNYYTNQSCIWKKYRRQMWRTGKRTGMYESNDPLREEGVKRTGLLDKVKASLDEAKIDYIELGGAVPNPRLSLVYEGIELAKKKKE